MPVIAQRDKFFLAELAAAAATPIQTHFEKGSFVSSGFNAHIFANR
jgi:hypothetical protein